MHLGPVEELPRVVAGRVGRRRVDHLVRVRVRVRVRIS